MWSLRTSLLVCKDEWTCGGEGSYLIFSLRLRLILRVLVQLSLQVVILLHYLINLFLVRVATECVDADLLMCGLEVVFGDLQLFASHKPLRFPRAFFAICLLNTFLSVAESLELPWAAPTLCSFTLKLLR